MAKELLDIISEFLGFDRNEVLDIVNKAQTSYKKYNIRKKRGGTRIIHHPSKQTKAIQHALMETVLSKLPIHECAYAYRREFRSPLRRNAEKHSLFSYSIRIDFKDFFPSIKPNDLFSVIDKNSSMELDTSNKECLTKALFVKSKDKKQGLAVGAPSSPLISNIVMYDLDQEIQKIAGSISRNNAYTRYADDLVFSTNNKGDCRKFYNKVKSLIKKTQSPRLIIKEDKTVYLSRGTRRMVTGITITPDQHISLGRRRKRYIKKLIFDYKNNKIEPKIKSYLEGFIAHILDVEPDYYNKLVIKYGGETLDRIRKHK
ncbi:MAG: retron St85 family RNA-directed DNA polymerase [Ignavibacteriales bacterium]|nr:retron St85 family RNA-directed DNA polymerase [Ignavibacteriales bacterium]